MIPSKARIDRFCRWAEVFSGDPRWNADRDAVVAYLRSLHEEKTCATCGQPDCDQSVRAVDDDVRCADWVPRENVRLRDETPGQPTKTRR